jgi:hypothetical protein
VRWVGWRHPIAVWSRFGAHMSIVALLSTVETSLLSWIHCGVWSCLQPLHVLVANNRGLKIAGVLGHLALQSCIALFDWMGPLQELLLDSIHSRVDLVVGSWGGYHCHIRAVSWIGIDVSKMTLLSTVVALPIWWGLCGILSSFLSLHLLTSHDMGLDVLRVLDTLGSGYTYLGWLILWVSLWTFIYIMSLFTTPRANPFGKGY